MSGSLHQNPVVPLLQDVCVGMSASGSRGTSCARSLYADLLRKVFKIFSAESCRSTCARSVCADLLSKISLSGYLHQDPVIPLGQNLCLRISCARSLCQDVCIRILQDLLCKISLCGSFARSPCQDVCIRLLSDLSV